MCKYYCEHVWIAAGWGLGRHLCESVYMTLTWERRECTCNSVECMCGPGAGRRLGAVGDVDTPHAVLDFYDTSSCGSNGGRERIGWMWSRKVKAGRLRLRRWARCAGRAVYRRARASTLGGAISDELYL